MALYMTYRNRADGQNSLPVCVFAASAPITSGKTVARIVLPDVSTDVKSGDASMHIFAVTIH